MAGFENQHGKWARGPPNIPRDPVISASRFSLGHLFERFDFGHDHHLPLGQHGDGSSLRQRVREFTLVR